MTPQLSAERLGNIFEEQAEFLSRADLVKWTRITAANRSTLAKLKGQGAKLLTGPRGSGKSSLMKAAYYELADGRDALPVYVNYARSMALEPLFHRTGNALQIFRQWVIMKALVATREAVEDLDLQLPPELARLAEQADAYVSALTVGAEAPPLEQPPCRASRGALSC